MKLKELRRYLGAGKLHLEEQERKGHLHYIPRLEKNRISLPSIIAISQGDGDVTLRNLKGVARSLGLKLRELQHSEACHIGRGCVLLFLAWEMLGFCLRRQQQMGGSLAAEAGVKAMAISVGLLLEHVETCHPASWSKDELRSLNRILPEVKATQENPVLCDVVGKLLAAIQQH